jgi:tetratricopeptide (TPR) repeat protein
LLIAGFPAMAFCQDEKKDEARPESEKAQTVSGQDKFTTLVGSIRTAYRQGRDNDVLALVDEAFLESTKSGDHRKDPELHFWRGASYRRLGKNEQALTSLELARVLGYQGAELYLESGLAHKSLGQTQDADRDYQEGQKYLPEDLTFKEHYNERWQREGKETTRFILSVTPSLGYDSNVVGLDPNTPLQQNIKHFDSAYEGLYLDVKWYLVRNEHQVLFLEYQGQGRQYPSSSEMSYLDNVVGLTGRQPLTDWADFELRGSVEEAFVKEVGHYRSERTAAPALILQPFHDLQVRIWGDYTNVTYSEASTPEEDRDGNIGRIGVTFPVDLHLDWSLAPYVSYDKYDAKGSDYKSHGWETGLTVLTPVYAGFKFAMTASYAEQDYDNLNSVTNFTEKRHDHPITLTIAVTLKQLESVIGYAPMISFTYYRHQSNISSFSYTRWAPQIEMGINALTF